MEQWIAAKGFIRNKEGKILIVREAATGKDTTLIGEWTLLGGAIGPCRACFGRVV